MGNYNKDAVNLGVLPDGVYPVYSQPNSLHLYYRNDGHLYFYNCLLQHEWDLTALQPSTPIILPASELYDLYVGVTTATINAGNIATVLTKHSIYLSNVANTILSGNTTPIEGNMYVVVPSNKSFKITQNSIDITGQFSFVGTVTVDNILYNIYKDLRLSYIDESANFYTRLL